MTSMSWDYTLHNPLFECPHCTVMKPSSAAMCAEALDNDLPCAQSTANKDATGQPASPPSPSITQLSTPLRPPVAFVSSAAAPADHVEQNFSFYSGEDIVSLHASDRDNLADSEEEDSFSV